MLGLVKPRHFIPVHGEYRMLVQHGLLAEGAGVAIDNIFVLENGQVVEFDGSRARLAGSVPSGDVLVDGIASIDGCVRLTFASREAVERRQQRTRSGEASDRSEATDDERAAHAVESVACRSRRA